MQGSGRQLAGRPRFRQLARSRRWWDKQGSGWESRRAGKAGFYHSLSLGIKHSLRSQGPRGKETEKERGGGKEPTKERGKRENDILVFL